MFGEEEAFPNSEQLIRRAFDDPNAPSELLKLIKQYPSYDTVSDILVCYTFIMEENPERAGTLAATLIAVRDATDAPLIGGQPALYEMFSSELVGLHSDCLQDETKALGPTNPFLLGSLLSGWSFKYKLLSCSVQYGYLAKGLNAIPASPTSEVLVTGACIQLLVGGSELIKGPTSYFKTADEVAAKLKAQKAAGTVKNVDALKILELAILHAETGFQKENDVSNVWEMLFPLSALKEAE